MPEQTTSFAQPVPYASVREAVRAYTTEWVSQHARALVVPAVVVVGLIGWAAFAEIDPTRAVVQVLWIPAMLAVLVFGYFRVRGVALFYKGIAAAWHWEYVSSALPTGYAAALFRVGHGQVLRNVLSGMVGASQAFIANYQYTIGFGKSAQTYTNTVAMFAFREQVPHLLLAVDKDRFNSEVLSQVENFKAVPLEGVFEKRVGLYVQAGFELEALQIMNVTLLEKLNTAWPQFSLEFVNSAVYVYAPRILVTRAEVEQLLGLLEYASKDLVPRLQRMQGSIRAMQEVVQDKAL